MLRIVGTIVGAVLGIALIAWLPQERELYLVLLSLCVTFFLYLGYAYQGDKTIFLLAAMTMMMVFKGGKTDDVFLYGVNRAAMTVFGVVLFTAVSIYLWPPKNEKSDGDVVNTGIPKGPKFLFFDPDNLRGALVSFLIFWCGTLAWIWFNPPGGFYLVTLATSFSLYTTFSPVKPSLLILVYTVAFFFATLAYVFILPHLHEGFELVLFLLIYTFLCFRLFKPELALFIAMGLAVMNIENQMLYHFGIFLNVLLLFYAFMFLLLLFYYLPFSTRPETMLLRTVRRFENLVRRLLRPTKSFWGAFLRREAEKLLLPTAMKMHLWASKTDATWYGLEKEIFTSYAHRCTEAVKNYLHNDGQNREKLRECMEHAKNLPLTTIQENGRF